MEDYVTYEQAVKLKELGFDWVVTHFYDSEVPQDGCIKGRVPQDFNVMALVSLASAPTLAQATKWLRSKNIEVYSYYDYTTKSWIFEVCTIGEPHFNGYHSDDFGLNKSTYEEAISAGIDIALDIYFNKK